DTVSCFFFSSRRRHTRLQGDWSSDVCSSDLGWLMSIWPLSRRFNPDNVRAARRVLLENLRDNGQIDISHPLDEGVINAENGKGRSEERRVGKEGEARRGGGR